MKKYGLFSNIHGNEKLENVYDTFEQANEEKEWWNQEDIDSPTKEEDYSHMFVREIEYTDEIKNFIKSKEMSHDKFNKAIQKLKENEDTSDLNDDIDFNELVEDLFNE